MAESEENKSSMSPIQIFLGIFVVTYFLWYIGGGPERWNNRYEKIGIQEIRENIVGEGVFFIDDQRRN